MRSISYPSRLAELKTALEIEIAYEKDAFQKLISQTSMQQKIEEGYCWYPISIEQMGFTLGEYPFLSIQIDPQKWMPSKLKSGAMIRFFQNLDGNITQNSVGASIYSLQKNKAKIILESNDFPDFTYEGKLGIILDYDQKSFDEMLLAIHQIQKEEKSGAAEVYRHFSKSTIPANIPEAFLPKNPHLNLSQIEAIEGILGLPQISVIHGPPGTGKTTTLVEAMVQLEKRGKKILASAPSNSAVDLITERLAAQGVSVLRIGHLSRVSDEVMRHTLEYKMEQTREFQDIKKLRKQADEYRRMALKYRRNFGKEEREQRQALLKEAREISKQIVHLEQYMVNKILDDSAVVCTTLVGSAHHLLEKRIFDIAIIDECSQALEPATWIPILKSERVVLAGDPHQLPPTVKTKEAEKLGLAHTLLDTAYQQNQNVYLLDTQYRMNPAIMHFPNQFFYEKKLKAHSEMENRKLPYISITQNPILYIDTAGAGHEEIQHPKTLSLYNPDEAQLVVNILDKIYSDAAKVQENCTIAVISPYKQQTIYLEELDREQLQLIATQGLGIHTIDSYQGQECDIVIISLVRANQKHEIGFLKDYRRMNVAITRAKSLLIIIGDSATIGGDEFYKQFIDFCMEQGYYSSVFEFMY